MRLIAVAGALGLVLLVGITLHFGWRDIIEAVRQVGYGVGLVVVARIVAISMFGCAWWCLVLGPNHVAPQICMLLRWMRESINTLLPVAQVGGEIVGHNFRLDHPFFRHGFKLLAAGRKAPVPPIRHGSRLPASRTFPTPGRHG